MIYFLFFMFFMLGGSLGSFAHASAGRLSSLAEKAENESSDATSATSAQAPRKSTSDDDCSYAEVFGELSRPSACPSCGFGLRSIDLVPVFSWLFLKGRCRKCSARIDFSVFAAEAVFAVGVSAAAFVLFPRLEADFGTYAGATLFALYCLGTTFAMISAATDAKTGFVLDFSALAGCACILLYLALVGEWTQLAAHCAVGWTFFLLSLTGKIGSGDAAPLAVFYSSAVVFYGIGIPADRLFVIFSAFMISVCVSAVSYVAMRRRSASYGGSPEKESFRKARFALVPHMAVAFAVVAVISPFFQ